ncbi:MAG: ATP-binding protein [Myxococcota bacterium]|nr:ATP-binding protein [Myxococcota bacterium]
MGGSEVRGADEALEREIAARAEARYRELAAYLPDFVTIIDRARRYRWFNRVAPGLSLDELLATGRVDDHIAPADLAGVVAAIEHVFETGESAAFETEAYADGVETAYYRTRVVPAAAEQGEPRVLMLTSDVTPQKRAELALRASERRVKDILRRLPDYVIELDAQRRIRFVNRTRPETTEDVVIGQRIDDLALPELRDEIARKLEHLFATGEEVKWSSESVVDAGSYDVHALPFPGDELRAIVVAKDMSREKQALVRLLASEERLERAVRAGNIGLWELDLATGVATGLGWFTSLIGREGTAVSLDEWSAAMHPDDRERASRALEEHVAGITESYECEYRVRERSTDTWRHVIDRARVVQRPGGGRVVAGTSIDVTRIRVAEAEHRALERQLEHVQRLESIGLLAGGIAHDFNNILTIIAAGAECVKRLVAADQRADAELAEIIEAALRASALTQQLLAFGRRSSLDLEDVDVPSLARTVAGLAARVFPKTIEITLAPMDPRAIARADRHRLEQVLLNLCMNSRDAMNDGGRLTISAEVDGNEVVVTVTDTGMGIAEADRQRIFEPFFTTKPVGAGSGLGLAVAHGIIQQHGGSIDVESEPGRGTSMRVRLPRQRASIASTPAVPLEAPRGGDETILIVDDEPLVLRMVKRTLEHAGYQVIEARDGAEAVEAFRERMSEIDLVFLDVLMPRLDGWRAQGEIRAIAPDARVLLTSGYSAPAIPEGDAAGPKLLPKPYHPDVLLRAIREALDEPR